MTATVNNSETVKRARPISSKKTALREKAAAKKASTGTSRRKPAAVKKSEPAPVAVKKVETKVKPITKAQAIATLAQEINLRNPEKQAKAKAVEVSLQIEPGYTVYMVPMKDLTKVKVYLMGKAVKEYSGQIGSMIYQHIAGGPSKKKLTPHVTKSATSWIVPHETAVAIGADIRPNMDDKLAERIAANG